MILLIDNYDSFVFNLARYVTELGVEAEVVRNDAVSMRDVIESKPEAIILSPGPCTPAEAGICVELVREVSGTIPLLGVCLGHQAIAAAFGAEIRRAPEPVHGRTSLLSHEATRLFEGLPKPLRVTRYHSLIADEKSLPDELKVTSRTDDGLVMAIEHREYPTFGVQFHPESILTQMGHALMRNFLLLSGIETSGSPVGDSLGETWIRDEIAKRLDSEFDQPWDHDPDKPLHW
ncbi:MAG: aminodeoxychorismate/anthranilate synthase component II [Planctomycetota bacterium]|nr:aminodeoxychorismate/anthranilate synthase component II [Planctomycetota bacterium]